MKIIKGSDWILDKAGIERITFRSRRDMTTLLSVVECRYIDPVSKYAFNLYPDVDGIRMEFTNVTLRSISEEDIDSTLRVAERRLRRQGRTA